MRPWCRTMPTVMESSHTSDATYLSTWMPKSFSTSRPEQTQKCQFDPRPAGGAIPSFTPLQPPKPDKLRFLEHLKMWAGLCDTLTYPWQCHRIERELWLAFFFLLQLEDTTWLVPKAEDKVRFRQGMVKNLVFSRQACAAVSPGQFRLFFMLCSSLHFHCGNCEGCLKSPRYSQTPVHGCWRRSVVICWASRLFCAVSRRCCAVHTCSSSRGLLW